MAGGPRRGAGLAEFRAHDAPQAVGPDQRIALPGPCAVGGDRHRIVGALDLRQARRVVQRDIGVLAHGGQQHAMQVGAVHAAIRRAVALQSGVAQRQPGQFMVVVGRTHHQRVGPRGDGVERIRQAQGMQAAHRVRPELDAGTDFGEDGRLLEQLDPMAALRQRQRARQAADAAAGDQELQRHPSSGRRWAARRWRPAALGRATAAAAVARTAAGGLGERGGQRVGALRVDQAGAVRAGGELVAAERRQPAGIQRHTA